MKRITLVVAVAVIALGLGSAGGAAVARTVEGLAPWNVTAESGNFEWTPAPSYETNAAGQTYGSAAVAPTPEFEPDLIEALATNGEIGYVYKVEIDRATGATAATEFRSPEEALAWQAEYGSDVTPITVYASDGRTPVGTFVVNAESTRDSTHAG